MKNKLRYFLVFTALTFTSHPVHVQASPSTEDNRLCHNTVSPPRVHGLYDYYEISGTCEQELKSDLIGKACRFTDGKKYDSLTRWRIGWDYTYDKSGGLCAAEDFHLTVDIIVRIPAWLHRASASPALVDRWEAYVEQLKTHENGHLDKIVQAADDLTRAVSLMPAARSCDELDREIGQLSRSRLKQLELEQNRYDAETSHGWTQGALFP